MSAVSRLLGIAVGLALSGIAVGYARAEQPSYRPAAGRIYTYGVEMRVFPTGNAARPELIRAKVRYRVTSVAADGWTAAYDTVPFGPTGPMGVTRPSSGSAMASASQRGPEMTPGFNVRLPPAIAQMEEAARTRSAQMQAQMELNRKHYPGAFAGVGGKLKIAADGEILEASGQTSMPRLAGQLYAIPLVRLPTSDGSTYSHKDIRGIAIGRPGGSLQQSAIAVLVSYSNATPSAEGLFTAARDFELIGGQTAGAELRASGEGTCDFSLVAGMPQSGNLELITSGLSYKGIGGELTVGISFLLLNDWQQAMFDLYLLPSEEGFSAKHLPRLTQRQQADIAQKLNKYDSSAWGLDRDLVPFAPPPPGSSLDKLVALFASGESPGRPQFGSAMPISRACTGLQGRWAKLRAVATEVPRTWSDASQNFSVKATMVGLAGDSARLQRVDNGQIINVPVKRLCDERLCDEDREFLHIFAARLGS